MIPDSVPDRSAPGQRADFDAVGELKREISGQPEAVATTFSDPTLERYLDRLASGVRETGELLVTGMGASLHCGLVLAEVLRGQGIRAWALPASDLLHYGERLEVKPVLILSQSGASAEVERLLTRAGEGRRGEQGAHVDGLTLDPGSPLGAAGAGVIPGGVERAFAATRSFTTTVAALYGLATRLGADIDLGALAGSLRPALEVRRVQEAAARVAGASTIFVTGRGPLHGLAEYVALMLMELTRVPCAALESAQLRHGPLEAAGEHLAVVALAARGGSGGLVRKLAQELAGDGSPVVLLDAGLEPEEDVAVSAPVFTIGLPMADEVAAVLPLAVCAQRLAVALAEGRGIRPGVPLRSSKVTREE